MATAGHIAVGLALGRQGLSAHMGPGRRCLVMAGFAFLALLPDIDMLWSSQLHPSLQTSLFHAIPSCRIPGATAG